MRHLLLLSAILLQDFLNDGGQTWRSKKIENYRKSIANALQPADTSTPDRPTAAPEELRVSIDSENSAKPKVPTVFLPSGKPLPVDALNFISEKAGESPLLIAVEWHSPKCRHTEFRLRFNLRNGKVLTGESKADGGVVVHGDGFELAVISSKDLVIEGKYTMFSHEDGLASFYLMQLSSSDSTPQWQLLDELPFTRQPNFDVRTVSKIPMFPIN